MVRAGPIAVVLCVGCPAPAGPSLTGDDTGGTTGSVCAPLANGPCTCDDGRAGTQLCVPDGSGFGPCSCPSDEGSAGSTAAESSTTAAPAECEIADDCAALMPSACESAVCDAGTCVLAPRPPGTACGDATATACSEPDTCDAAGSCEGNHAAAGQFCSGCALGVCGCAAGVCDDCTSAPTNDFATAAALDGWTLGGSWGLYREAPPNFSSGAVAFASQVFGNDGNRVAPYPGNEVEIATARTRPTILPASLEFASWHVDQGAGADTKLVRVSIDGGASHVTLVNCTADPTAAPFCALRDDTRAADDWDAVSLPLPVELVGQVGVVEFFYNTVDSCCDFERGWYLDAFNFAGACASRRE